MSTNNKYMIAPILTLILSGLTRAQDEEGIKIDISSSMRGKWQNLRSPVEKAIQTDSHTKHSDRLVASIQIQQDLLSCRLQKFDCASLKGLA